MAGAQLMTVVDQGVKRPMDAKVVIETLKLIENTSEGGYFREFYRSVESIPQGALPGRYVDNRHFATSIHYLITDTDFSALHKLVSDEIYHFYDGDPVNLCLIHHDGSVEEITLGPDLASGDTRVAVVPHGVWQGSYVKGDGRWALLGCTVAPAFEFVDYELGGREELIAQFPQHRDVILRLTR